jgi:hypothetical protein
MQPPLTLASSGGAQAILKKNTFMKSEHSKKKKKRYPKVASSNARNTNSKLKFFAKRSQHIKH